MVDIFSLLLIAFGLSIDSFTISLTGGMLTKREKIKSAVRISSILAVVQTGIATLGWVLGFQIEDFLSSFSSWFGVGLLSFVGIRMIYLYFRENKKDKNNKDEKDNEDDDSKMFSSKLVPLLALLISFDELAVGISLALLNVPFWEVLSTLFLVIFSMSFVGILIGRKIGLLLKKKADLICGILFIIIAIANLIEF